MKMPLKKFWTAALCALCAAALTLPAWATGAAKGTVAAESARTVVSAPGMEREDLFYGYLLQRAGVSDRVSLMADAGSKLNAKDKELYDWLKVFVAKVADGEETSAVYTVTYDDFPLIWTKEDLGVSAIYQVSNRRLSLTDECRTAVVEKFSGCFDYDLTAVMRALLADCPYDMYWFDKTADSPLQANPVAPLQIALFDDEGEIKVKIGEVPVCDMVMAVSPDYAGEDSLTVSRALHAGIESVTTKAQSIVSAYRNESDYGKLLGYATEICNLVEYDDAAADSATNASYGDPWQLISVFDGDPNTNVVCEGYAKAFQYLCDLSRFDSPKVECYLIGGDLSDSAGAEAHMWNIVTMENGNSYLTDVTNSDTNGDPEYFLLKGGTPSASNSRQYTFYGWLTFVYDNETVQMWGEELLTLDTVDYKDAPPVTPSPALRLGGYALSASGEAVSMAHIRDGATIAVTKDASETESNIILFLAAYDAQGRMENLQQWDLDFSRSPVFIQTQAVNASRAKFIILNENLTPLASAATLE